MMEGLRWGDLHVEHSSKFTPLKELFGGLCPRRSRRFIRVDRDEGEIEGVRREAGKGWIVYERDE